VGTARAAIANAVRSGKPAPHDLPHPDGVVFDRERGARVVGPNDEVEQMQLKGTLQVRDLLVAQDV
jgi:hypothetical protein